jgi:uncharacterized protein
MAKNIANAKVEKRPAQVAKVALKSKAASKDQSTAAPKTKSPAQPAVKSGTPAKGPNAEAVDKSTSIKTVPAAKAPAKVNKPVPVASVNNKTDKTETAPNPKSPAKAVAPAKPDASKTKAAVKAPASDESKSKPAKEEKIVSRPAIKKAPAAKEASTDEPKVIQVETEMDLDEMVTAIEEIPAIEEKELVKTVEQQMFEAQATEIPTDADDKSEFKEESFVPKYTLPVAKEVARPSRPKPVPMAQPSNKPVANPIHGPAIGDGKTKIKFAPIAVIERHHEKEKSTLKSEDTEDMALKTSPRLALNDGDDKKGVTVEDKLRALYDIQLIDSRIDKIHAMRGELPIEVQDLEDEVAGLDTRIAKLNDELKTIDDDTNAKKQGIKDSEALIKKYKEQLNNVKNNREFDSLNKEVEYQELEIQLHKKRMKDFEMLQKQKQDLLDVANVKLSERNNDLKVKKNELEEIISETEKEEKILRAKSDDAKKLIEERLLAAYERIRSGAPNGMAVVPIEREASAGSFIQLPPQKQLDVAARKRVIVDEHSGRILVDADLAREESEKIDALLNKELTK